MKQLFVLLALTAVLGCSDRSPIAPIVDGGFAVSPFEDDLRSDPRILELVALATFTPDELLAIGYPAENLTPVHGERLLRSLRASYGIVPPLSRQSDRSPFNFSYASEGRRLAMAEWPEWLKAARDLLARTSCRWADMNHATNMCGLQAAGAMALTRQLPAGYIVMGTCVVKVVADHCSIR